MSEKLEGGILPQESEKESPSTQGIERAETAIEWAVEMGAMTWTEVEEKLEELNSQLKEGEKSWRLPTKSELAEAFSGENLVDFVISEEDKREATSDRNRIPAHWSSSVDEEKDGNVLVVYKFGDEIGTHSENPLIEHGRYSKDEMPISGPDAYKQKYDLERYFVRFVRDKS